jgi:Fe-S-cluster containining protein
MDDKPPPVPADLVEEIDVLLRILEARPDQADVARKLEWLVDALVIRGQLPKDYAKRVMKIGADRSSVRLTLVTDKYTKDIPEIDCASRLHLCKARCCRFEVALSEQDIKDGIPFEIERPYMLPRDPSTKKCVCMDAGGACTIYDKRPASCRVYDCRGDVRVWIDFEARIPAPMPERIRGDSEPEQ